MGEAKEGERDGGKKGRKGQPDFSCCRGSISQMALSHRLTCTSAGQSVLECDRRTPAGQPSSKHVSERLDMQGSLALFPLLNETKATDRKQKCIRNFSHKEVRLERG